MEILKESTVHYLLIGEEDRRTQNEDKATRLSLILPFVFSGASRWSKYNQGIRNVTERKQYWIAQPTGCVFVPCNCEVKGADKIHILVNRVKGFANQ
jgi:hypothetical protein